MSHNRVAEKIGPHVYAFCRARLKTHRPRFFMEELVSAVRDEFDWNEVAPDSPSRILRMLRQRGAVDYICLQRALSLYQVMGVRQC